MTANEKTIQNIESKIASDKAKGYSWTEISAGTHRQVLRHFLNAGYRLILKDSFDGSCCILVCWDKQYEPDGFWESEIFDLEDN